MLKNMQIGKRLILLFIIVAVLASCSGIITAVFLKTTDTKYSEALVDYGFAQGDIGKLCTVFTKSKGDLADVVNMTVAANVDAAKNELKESQAKIEQYMPAVEKSLQTTEGKAAYKLFTDNLQKYREVEARAYEMGDTTDPERSKQARQMMVDELAPIYEATYQALASIMEIKVSAGDEISTQLTNTSNTLIMLAFGIILATLVIAIILAVVVANGISIPIKTCAERLSLLAKGDLKTKVIAYNQRDEIGILSKATSAIVEDLDIVITDASRLLNEMSNGDFDIHTEAEDRYMGDFVPLLTSMRAMTIGLSDTMGQINESADQVSSGSDQVSSGAQALSQGATEQASSIEELSATIADMSNQIKSNAESAKSARESSTKASVEISESNRQMEEMIKAMAEISGKSSEIGKIIKTIEDIAFQTNILALNAAVEAARAGAAGKGFAVVADEVRNLAGKSAEAAKNTTALIEETVTAVENGTKIASATAESMIAVVDGSKEVTALVEQIAAASTDQAASASQITQGVEQISAVIQTNSATAEESAAASEELSGQSRMLKELVSQFKLRRTGNPKINYEAPASKKSTKSSAPAVINMDGDKY
ncbi:MAG: methyl-accepting chemotaxis protein [Oscillospiraceae bacterium]